MMKNENSVSIHAKCIYKRTTLSHYDTAIKSECFCIGKSNFVQESRRRKRWEKNTESHGNSRLSGEQYRFRTLNRKYTEIQSDVKKRRLQSFGYIKRMNPYRRTKRLI